MRFGGDASGRARARGPGSAARRGPGFQVPCGADVTEASSHNVCLAPRTPRCDNLVKNQAGVGMYEIIGAIIGPLVTALLAGITVLGRQWQASKRSEADLEQLATEAAFLQSWVAARERLRPLNVHEQQTLSTALERLDAQYRGVRIDQAKLRQEERTPTGVRLARGVLLLEIVGAPAKVLRVFYWITLVFGVLGMILFIAVSTESSDNGVAATIFAAAILSAACYVPAVVMGIVTRLVSSHVRAKREQQAALKAVRDGRGPRGYFTSSWSPGHPASAGGLQSASPPPPQAPAQGPAGGGWRY